MSDTRYAELAAFLKEEIGEGLTVVLSYREDDVTVHHQTAAAERFFEGTANLSAAEASTDLVLGSMELTMDEERYGVDSHAQVNVSDAGMTCQLPRGETEGVLFAVGRDTSIRFPDIVDDCLDVLDEG